MQLICDVLEHDHESSVFHGQENSSEEMEYFMTILVAGSYNNLFE